MKSSQWLIGGAVSTLILAGSLAGYASDSQNVRIVPRPPKDTTNSEPPIPVPPAPQTRVHPGTSPQSPPAAGATPAPPVGVHRARPLPGVHGLVVEKDLARPRISAARGGMAHHARRRLSRTYRRSRSDRGLTMQHWRRFYRAHPRRTYRRHTRRLRAHRRR